MVLDASTGGPHEPALNWVSMDLYQTKSYRLIPSDHPDATTCFGDKKTAMIALMLSDNNSTLQVEWPREGEISVYRKHDGRIKISAIQGKYWMNFVLSIEPAELDCYPEIVDESSHGFNFHESYTVNDVLEITRLATIMMDRMNF
jgi:hypothetical protein